MQSTGDSTSTRARSSDISHVVPSSLFLSATSSTLRFYAETFCSADRAVPAKRGRRRDVSRQSLKESILRRIPPSVVFQASCFKHRLRQLCATPLLRHLPLGLVKNPFPQTSPCCHCALRRGQDVLVNILQVVFKGIDFVKAKTLRL